MFKALLLIFSTTIPFFSQTNDTIIDRIHTKNMPIKILKNNLFVETLSILLDLIFILLLSISFYFSRPVYTSSSVLFIPKGSTKSIISYLHKADVDINELDYYILRFIGYPQSGWLDMQTTAMTKIDFLTKLTTSKAAMRNITLIPGETNYFFLQQIAQKFGLDYKKLFIYLNQYAYKLEGSIIADTYSFPLGITEKHIMYSLIQKSDDRYKKLSKKVFGNYNKSQWYRYVIIASIIQKESASNEEMPIVSSVIYNRLKKNMALQMDGTLNYGKYSHQKVTSKRIKEDNSIYNTYKSKGLPSQPVCTVSIDAVKSAIFPARTDYLYFMLHKSGTRHIFTNSYKQHRKTVKANIRN
jgi:UPF0755 protein